MRRSCMVAATTLALVATLVSVVSGRVAGVEDGRTNIVVLMLDDMPAEAARELLARQPRISSFFLQRGQRWANFYANDPLCCPGRASFLTGLYSHHHGVTRNDARLFEPYETIATSLDDSGYYTAIVGKYLNGLTAVPDKTPPGWDKVAITAGGYYRDWWVNGTMVPHSDRSDPSDYSTDVLAAQAVSFLREAPAGAPVFLYLNPFATHALGSIYSGPEPAPRHAGDPGCGGMPRYATPAYNEVDVSDKPTWVQQLPRMNNPSLGWPQVAACRALLSVDEMFGLVRDELQAQGRDQATLFMLVADNGMAWGDHRVAGKGVPYATHLPFWVRWPARNGAKAETVLGHGQMIDLAPTLADLAGTDLGPFPTGQVRPDGVSLLPTILGGSPPARPALYEEHSSGTKSSAPPWDAIRTTDGRWHYIEYDNGAKELYDLAVDPWQLRSKHAEAAYEDVRARLAARLAALRDGPTTLAGR